MAVWEETYTAWAVQQAENARIAGISRPSPMDLKEVSQMSQEKKERVGILMPPSQVAEIDALYPLHGHASRSDFVCKAVEFYTGFLQQGSSEFYMNKTTLAFLEEQLGRLKEDIEKNGAVDNFVQGRQSMLRESPAMKAYCTLVQRYGDLQKKLADLLPEKKDAQKSQAGDRLAAFVAKGKK